MSFFDFLVGGDVDSSLPEVSVSHHLRAREFYCTKCLHFKNAI